MGPKTKEETSESSCVVHLGGPVVTIVIPQSSKAPWVSGALVRTEKLSKGFSSFIVPNGSVLLPPGCTPDLWCRRRLNYSLKKEKLFRHC